MRNFKKRLLKTRLMSAILATVELANVGMTSYAMMPSDLEAVSEESGEQEVCVVSADGMGRLSVYDLFEYLKIESTDDELRLYCQNGTLDKSRQDVESFKLLSEESKNGFFDYVAGLAYESTLEDFTKLPMEVRTEFFEFVLRENCDLERILLALSVDEKTIHTKDLKAFVHNMCGIMTPRVAGIIFARLHEGEDEGEDLLIAATIEDDYKKLIKIGADYRIQYDEDMIGRRLMEYAMLTESVEVFQHLLLVGVEITEDAKIYALIGGIYEIIHWVEDNSEGGYGEVINDKCLLDGLISGDKKDILIWLQTNFEEIKKEDIFIRWCRVGTFSFLIDWLRETCPEEMLSEAIGTPGTSLKEEMIKLFLANGADVNASDDNGVTALVFAAHKGRTELVQFLLANGADVNAVDKRGQTALMATANGGHTDVAEMLLANEADVNAVDKRGQTALMAAAYGGHTDMAEMLLLSGADVNAVDKRGQTALMAAANGGHIDVAAMLIANGADVNAARSDGWTALMFAAQKGKTEMVQFLLERGADMNAVNQNGMTALRVAAQNGNSNLAELLKANGAT